MVIKISNLKEGEHYFEFENNIEVLELKEPFFGNYRVDIKLHKLQNQILLNAELKTNANFECDRCGVSYNSTLKGNFQIVYLFGDSAGDNTSENRIYLSRDADKIKIFTELRDYAILSIPMKKLCSDDCKGLCYKCGKNLNDGLCDCESRQVNTKWQPLLELKKREFN
jgi:uncharacterized protein